MSAVRRYFSVLATLGLLALMLPLSATPVLAESAATTLPGFRDELVWSGIELPTAVVFAPSGRAFVAQKNGKLLTFSSITDTSATLVKDFGNEVFNNWDRGMLALTIDPDFPSRPYLYIGYTYDHILGEGGAAPRWGQGNPSDPCPDPPGGNTDGCIVSSRVERITVDGTTGAYVARHELLEDWCQQFPSHTIGTLAFGPEGALYVSGGDGASFDVGDWGQLGGTEPPGGPYPTPANPCNDPVNEGGAVRSQDYRTNGDPMGLDGTIARIDPDTGDAWPANANAGNADDNKARVIAYGLRNPFRYAIRANGNIWVGDVGWSAFEEIDRITDADAAPKNFGWPCWEGTETRPQYENVPLCLSLSGDTKPVYTYGHLVDVVNGDDCATGSNSMSGMVFLPSTSTYPSSYDTGLFFTDYSRSCIWWIPDDGGVPDFDNVKLFANLLRSGAEIDGGAVWIGLTPARDIIYTDFNRDEVRQITYSAGNTAPSASFTASPQDGPNPLTVHFDASGSSDADGDSLSYAWDLDDDGAFDDSTSKTPTKTYTQDGEHTVTLRVTDNGSPAKNDTDSKVISVGQWAPKIAWPTPATTFKWKEGTVINFTATAEDEDGPVDASGFEWTLILRHCGPNCSGDSEAHSHPLETVDGETSGSFVAPYHGWGTKLKIELRVTDSDGLTTYRYRNLVQSAPFTDMTSSKFAADIYWLENQGITTGCGNGSKFCPDGKVSRAQMATFMARALDLPAATKDWFNDDNGNSHEADINRIREAGITIGCATNKYCPDVKVSRAQMASFLARGFSLSVATKNYFNDDNNSNHEPNINRVAKAGITVGCAPNKYCPSSIVTRGQMAAFLHRAMGDT